MAVVLLVRSGFILLCVALAWSFWFFSQSDFQFPAQLRVMTGAEILAVTGLTIAIFSGFQGLFRWLATPRLELCVHSVSGPLPISTGIHAVHHIEVWNVDWPLLFRPLFSATSAEGCEIKFQYFKELDGKLVAVLDGQWLHGRWNANPQPLASTPTGVYADKLAAEANRRLARLFPTERKNHVDSHPYTVGFAIKEQGDEDFYHFNDLSYVYHNPNKPWCNDDWRMGPGAYLVKVRVTGYGLLGPMTATFRLNNSGTTHKDFVLTGPIR
ncbi:MAG: hypothetical protein M1305_07475 [Candidatus Marsarchaeota archaeon]|nr:hypothetical protein [Candidatus Marsarchaeota archaeon]